MCVLREKRLVNNTTAATFMKNLFTFFFACVVANVALAQSTKANPTPFGLEISKSTCADAKNRFGDVNSQFIGGDLLLKVSNPAAHYDGATELMVRCSQDIVIAIQLTASKGGMGNTSAKEAYSSLTKKYKLVGGGPMPSVGNGYAKFVAGNTVIEEDSPHMSFEFTVAYYDKSFYELLNASSREESKKKQSKKQSSL